MHTERRGLLRLFNYVVNKKVDVVVQLTEISFEYLEYFSEQHGVGVDVAFGEEPEDARQELVEDLIAVTSFAGETLRYDESQKRNL